jgi:MFS family permease
MTSSTEARKRWWALYVLCAGVLMIVLDTTIVNVALPSIREDLRFNETALVWVVNAYMLTFGGFLLLGGRLGDLYGQRRLFLVGLALFTLASLACGLSNSQALLDYSTHRLLWSWYSRDRDSGKSGTHDAFDCLRAD